MTEELGWGGGVGGRKLLERAKRKRWMDVLCPHCGVMSELIALHTLNECRLSCVNCVSIKLILRKEGGGLYVYI